MKQAQGRAAEIVKAQTQRERGPNLTLLKDPKTGQIFETQNLKNFDPAELDPIVRARFTELMKGVEEGKIPKYEKWQENSMHSEIIAASDAIKARRAQGIPVGEATLKEFEIVNIILRGSETGQPRPQCPYCLRVLPEVRDIGMAGQQ